MEVRAVRPEEYKLIIELQKKIWDYSGSQLKSETFLTNAVFKGGHVLGAFNGSDLLGFSIDEPAEREGKLIYYSVLVGVLEDDRGKGAGYELKSKQREILTAKGIDLLIWTFDSLRSANAYLNIEKLGGIIQEYDKDHYPEGVGGVFNEGLRTDRVILEWYLNSGRVNRFMSSVDCKKNPIEIVNYKKPIKTVSKKGILVPDEVNLDLGERYIAVEAPYTIDDIKKVDKGAAIAWQDAHRETLLPALEKGFTAARFIVDRTSDSARSFYLLEKDFKIPKPATTRVGGGIW